MFDKRRLMLGLGWADPGDHRNLQETADLGTVTNPTGTIGGRDYADLIDAYAFETGGYWTVVLTDRPDGCARKTKLCDEEVLIFGFGTTTPTSGTYTVGTDPVSVSNKTYNERCREEAGGGPASGGTLTITSVTDIEITGSYDVQFGGDTVTGSFVATKC